MQTRQEFGMAAYGSITAATLARNLLRQRQGLQQDIEMMQRDLALVQDDANFKRWLREQHKLAQELDPMQMIEEILAAARNMAPFERR